MNPADNSSNTGRWQRVAGWFLMLSYLAGSTVYALIEANTGLFSERLGYSSEFLYAVAATQVISALFLRSPRWAPWSCAILSVLSLGAVYSHLRIDSPLTAIPAVAYTLIQAWYGFRVARNSDER